MPADLGYGVTLIPKQKPGTSLGFYFGALTGSSMEPYLPQYQDLRPSNSAIFFLAAASSTRSLALSCSWFACFATGLS